MRKRYKLYKLIIYREIHNKFKLMDKIYIDYTYILYF